MGPLLLALTVLLPARAPEAPLRVLTWNIQHGVGADGHLDLDRVARVIRAARPDLVSLQEVDRGTRRSGGTDQAHRLAELTGLHARYAPFRAVDGGTMGVAVLSRWAPSRVRVEPLAAARCGEARVVLVVRVPTSHGPARCFLATHLDHRASRAGRRAFGRRIGALDCGPDSAPPILAGDLNDPPHGPVLRSLRSWRSARTGPTYRNRRPTRQVDYVVISPRSSLRFVSAAALPESEASDHRPVLAVLR